ncbi:MAG: carboxypeptidase M32 [Candidatus Aminicenantes bacterium]|nr:carboxypeptidase M32 [Candidatus Aminicenantes bacterium]NIQ73467.1 carboxypeptidase M32 [Candidatus Aminicenantes bacterium]NIT29536.1 carboxypeptidase M32 [Candidatus Aminicenantes bacterium]
MNIKFLKELLLEIKKINSIVSVLQWDQDTYMPEGSGDIRAEHISYLSTMAHNIQTSDKFKSELQKVVDMKTGDPLEQDVDKETRRLLYLIWKDYKDAAALPPEFVKELSLHSSKSQQVWAKARQENDYKTFAPYLEKMVQLKKQEAEYYGYETTPYDSLLDKFEPRMTSERVTILFDEMRDRLIQLVKNIKNSGMVIDEGPLKQSFDVDKQWEFGMKVAEAMGFDLEYGRQDKSAHPFTTSFHPTDVRITTRLAENNFKSALFATIHETGHALYEQGLPTGDYGTPFGEPVSYGFHESQSRLWENFIGRSRIFWDHFYPILKDLFNGPLKSVSQEQFYKMVNTVTPSLIRVEADEVTYSLHIMLRFEIEKMLINENLPVKELPDVWNQKMEDYLGIRPPDYKDGVLQDVHWSMGAIGYFPSYALGNLYAAPIMNQAWKDIPQLAEQVKAGELLPLREWLREKIHNRGYRMFAEELIRDLTGTPLSAKPFLDYLEKKYSEIYGISRK